MESIRTRCRDCVRLPARLVPSTREENHPIERRVISRIIQGGRTGFVLSNTNACREMNSMHKLRILILYPDPAGLALLTSMLKSLGHIIEEATNDRIAVKLMERNNIDLVLAGVDPLDGEALELLTYVRRKHREVPVILLFPRLHPERAKEALRLGAMAVLKYPVPGGRAAGRRVASPGAVRGPGAEPSQRRSRVAALPPTSARPIPRLPSIAVASDRSLLAARSPRWRSIQCLRLAFQARQASGGADADVGHRSQRVEHLAREIGLIGTDPSWRQVIDLAATIAATRTSVLIVGEPGTGKSLLARLIHSLGPNPERPFITVESSAMADELSSHEPAGPGLLRPGAMTPRRWTNKLAQAQGGTLYLDEVAALPLEFQLNLLRELHFRDYEASTGHPQPSGDARFVMSTSENLPALIEQGRFRQELYHRISVISLMLPPFGTAGPTSSSWPSRSGRTMPANFTKPSPASPGMHSTSCKNTTGPATSASSKPPFSERSPFATARGSPRAIWRRSSTTIARHVRSAAAMPRPHLKMGVRPLKEALEEPEKRIIIQALQAFNWNRQETARVLDINRTTLYKKMKKYNLLIDEPVWAN